MQYNSFTDRKEATARKLVAEWTGKEVTLHVRAHKGYELVLRSERLPLSPIAILPLGEAGFRHLEPGSLEEHFPDGSPLSVQLLGYIPERRAWYATRRPLEFANWAEQYPPGTLEQGRIVGIFADRVSVRLDSGLAGTLTARSREWLEAAGKLRQGFIFDFEVYGWFGREWEVQLDLSSFQKERLVALDYKRWAPTFPEGTLLRGRLALPSEDRALVELEPGFTGELGPNDGTLLQAAGRLVPGESVSVILLWWNRNTGRARLMLAEHAEGTAAARRAVDFSRGMRGLPRGTRVRGLLRIQRDEEAAEIELSAGLCGKLRDEDCAWLHAVGRWREGEELDLLVHAWCFSFRGPVLELIPPATSKSSPLLAERMKKYPARGPLTGRIKALPGSRAVVELDPGIAGLLGEDSCAQLRHKGQWRLGGELKVVVSSWNQRDAIPYLALSQCQAKPKPEPERLPRQAMDTPMTGRIVRLLPGTAFVELKPGLMAQLVPDACAALKVQDRWRTGEEIEVDLCNDRIGLGLSCTLTNLPRNKTVARTPAPSSLGAVPKPGAGQVIQVNGESWLTTYPRGTQIDAVVQRTDGEEGLVSIRLGLTGRLAREEWAVLKQAGLARPGEPCAVVVDSWDALRQTLLLKLAPVPMATGSVAGIDRETTPAGDKLRVKLLVERPDGSVVCCDITQRLAPEERFREGMEVKMIVERGGCKGTNTGHLLLSPAARSAYEIPPKPGDIREAVVVAVGKKSFKLLMADYVKGRLEFVDLGLSREEALQKFHAGETLRVTVESFSADGEIIVRPAGPPSASPQIVEQRVAA